MEGIFPPGPPPAFMVPMAEMLSVPASTKAELSARCPSEVEGIVPFSWPRMLSASRFQ